MANGGAKLAGVAGRRATTEACEEVEMGGEENDEHTHGHHTVYALRTHMQITDH
jgi:hypothetical protein